MMSSRQLPLLLVAHTLVAALFLTDDSHAYSRAFRTTKPRSHFTATRLHVASAPAAAIGTEITMPALSSTMKEGRVVSWLKAEGDEIEAGEAIMVVESDKADMDVEAFEDGYLAKILVAAGEMAPVGQAVALMAPTVQDIEAVAAQAGAGSSTSRSGGE
jgi:pyruvate dehydrogenase E2 component (dihydrolipoamide acetyltransferase)